MVADWFCLWACREPAGRYAVVGLVKTVFSTKQWLEKELIIPITNVLTGPAEELHGTSNEIRVHGLT